MGAKAGFGELPDPAAAAQIDLFSNSSKVYCLTINRDQLATHNGWCTSGSKSHHWKLIEKSDLAPRGIYSRIFPFRIE